MTAPPRALGLVAILLIWAPRLAAQMTVSGIVSDAAGGPIQGAAVAIPSLSLSTRTTADGRYAFIIRQAQVMGQTATVTARHSRFGAQTVQIRIVGGSLEQNFTLGRGGQAMDRPPGDTVPLPGAMENPDRILATSSRIVRYPSHTVGVETAAGPVDLVSALAGRHASLQVNSANTPDGAASMLYRGARSFFSSTAPLLVVDGIAVDHWTFTSTGQRFGLGGFDFGSPLNDIAIDDIATVDLLDPVAATLRYGARAANGVLQVRTRRGAGLTGVHLTASTRYSAQSAAALPAFQNAFGQGRGGAFEFFDGRGGGIHDAVAESWGPRLDARPIAQHSITEPGRPDVRHWQAQPDDLERFYGAASTLDANVALTGAVAPSSDRSTNFRLALNARTASGLTPNADVRRLGAAFGGDARFGRRMTTMLDARFSGTFADQRSGTGFDEVNPAAAFTRMGRQVDLDVLRANVRTMNGEQINWIYTDRNNPWFGTTANDNQSDRRHSLAGLSLTYDLTSWLATTLRTAVDDWTETRLVSVAPGWLGGFPTSAGRRDFAEGGSDNQTVSATETLIALGLTARRNLSGWGLGGAIGGELRASEFSAIGVVTDNAADVISVAERGTHDVTSFLVHASATRGSVQLDGGARLEQSSAPRSSYSAVFPSAQVTYDIASGVPALGKALRLGDSRLVARWWKAGNEITSRTLASAFFGGAVAAPESVTGPERTQGLEVGLVVNSPAHRFGLDVVAYRERSTNVLTAFLPGDGTASLAQTGAIFNGGVHAQLGGTLIDGDGGIDGTIRLSVARNRSTVDAVHPSDPELHLSPDLFGARLAARVGGEAGVIIGSRYLRTADGSLVLRNGLPMPDAATPFSVLGSVHPDWRAALDTRWSYGGLQLYALVDARFGGKVFSATNMWGSYAGTLESTLVGDRATAAPAGDSLTLVGIDSVSGTANTTRVSAEQYFHALGAIAEPWVYDASYVKLREARISYGVPTRFLPGFREHSLRLSLIGRNLFTWADAPNIDPESIQFPGFEMGQLPTARSFGVQVSIAP